MTAGSVRRRLRAGAPGVALLCLLGLLLALLSCFAPQARAAACHWSKSITVPGAKHKRVDCLDDLLTPSLQRSGHTDSEDWSGLHASGTRNPSGPVPGVQVDGYFHDDSRTNANNGWFHDSQFVIRLPEQWNGKLVITGAPGVRGQYANDFIFSDWLVARGYAFASTDKGNTGTSFYNDGSAPGGSIREWHQRVTELTLAAKAVVRQRYGRAPQRTYITGISNGGYLTRWQLENNPQLFDGGVDWEGTFYRPEGPNLHTYLPAALKHYPTYLATGSEQAHAAMIAAGFEPGSEFLWEYHYLVYWDLTQRVYREEIDPEYDGTLQAGIPFCQSGVPNCDADYNYFSRPQAVRDVVSSFSLTGNIGKPLLTLHGNMDTLLPVSTNAEPYAALVRQQGQAETFRYYVVEGGNHVDSLYGSYPDRLRPILPCHRAAFLALERWVESDGGYTPPADHTITRLDEGDLLNQCSLWPFQSAFPLVAR